MIALAASLLLLHAACSSQNASAIDISGIDRSIVFAKLFNNAQRSRPWLRRRTMHPSEAKSHIGVFREEVDGVVMRVRVPSEEEASELDARAYDEEYGAGEAERVVKKLQRKMRSADAYGSRRPCSEMCCGSGVKELCSDCCIITGASVCACALCACGVACHVGCFAAVGAAVGASIGACAGASAPGAGAAAGAAVGAGIGGVSFCCSGCGGRTENKR